MQIQAQSSIHTGVSTLLVSARHSSALDRLLRLMDINDLLNKLMSCGVPTNCPRGAMRIRYQVGGQGLVRRDFRVDQATWFRLGQIARTCGVSRCLLFVILLERFAKKVSEFRRKSDGIWRLTEIFDFRYYRRTATLLRLRISARRIQTRRW